MTDQLTAMRIAKENAEKGKKAAEAQVDELNGLVVYSKTNHFVLIAIFRNRLLEEESKSKSGVAKARSALDAELAALRVQVRLISILFSTFDNKRNELFDQLEEETADRVKEAALKQKREQELEEMTQKYNTEVAAKSKVFQFSVFVVCLSFNIELLQALEAARVAQRALTEKGDEHEEVLLFCQTNVKFETKKYQAVAARAAADKLVKKLQAEIDDLNDQLDAAAKAATAQVSTII